MSYTRPFGSRERALEEAFFRKESDRLIEAMRAKKTREKEFEALSRSIGMSDPEIIDPLLDLGLRETNVTALVMAPLIAVAWADHKIESDERRLIDESADALGIEHSGEGGELLEIWLNHRPDESLLDAWVAYVHELRKVLGEEATRRLRDDLLARSKRIARSLKKSLLRGGGPTPAEVEVIERIEAAFDS